MVRIAKLACQSPFAAATSRVIKLAVFVPQSVCGCIAICSLKLVTGPRTPISAAPRLLSYWLSGLLCVAQNLPIAAPCRAFLTPSILHSAHASREYVTQQLCEEVVTVEWSVVYTKGCGTARTASCVHPQLVRREWVLRVR
eukprot:COSAG02_NODE_1737_length_11150_cov_15.164420_6_plen_141_part_00